VIRLENLPVAIATGDADKIRKFVDSFMAEYDLDGWLAPDLINPTDINWVRKSDKLVG
jgi:4-hydroxyphenylacetate 3-monooxygenase